MQRPIGRILLLVAEIPATEGLKVSNLSNFYKVKNTIISLDENELVLLLDIMANDKARNSWSCRDDAKSLYIKLLDELKAVSE